MKILLEVYLKGQYKRWAASVEVPELYRETFAPIRITDDPILRYATGDLSMEAAKIVMKTREDAAEILSEQLTKLLVDAMKKDDTYNGYPMEESK